ncbi:uncharacterized mitochondrial protein-like protein [Tanacetum coccineum]
MSRDVIMVGSTMRIPLLYRGEYSQWSEQFMNYLEEKTDDEAMINYIKNGEHRLPVTAEEKKNRKIDRLPRSLLIQGLPNDIYSLIDSNDTTKDLWDALEREKVVVQLESEGSDDEDISDLKKITALLAKDFNRKKYYAKPTNNNLRTSSASSSANKKPEYVKSEEKKEDKKADEKKWDMSKVKCYNCKKEGHFAKDCKKEKVKDYNYYKTKMLLAKKDGDEQVLLAEDQAWMESSSDSDQEISANMVFMAKMEKVLLDSEESSSSAKETIAEVSYYTFDSESESEYETSEYYDNSTNYGLFVDNDDDQEIFHDAIEYASEIFNENHIVSQTDHDESEVDHNDYEEKDHLVDKLIKKFNQNIAKCHKRIEKANQQSKYLENQNNDLQDKYDVLKNQVITFEEKNNEFNEQIKVLNKKNDDLLAQTEVLQGQLKVKHVVIDTHTECQTQYAKLEEERYEYMIRCSALCDNDKQHRKKIDEQQILLDKMSRQLVEMNNNVLRLQEKILEKQTKISELEECVRNKDLEIETCFENPSYICKAKELRPSLYDEKVIGLGYTLMFLTHSDEALEIKKFKRAKENKIEFAYDYGNLNESYVNEKINFLDDYFQEIINPDFEKTDSPFQQTSSLKPYVPTVILEKIIMMKIRLYDSYDVNDLFVFDDVSIINSRVSKMPFRKKPRDSLNVHCLDCLWDHSSFAMFKAYDGIGYWINARHKKVLLCPKVVRLTYLAFGQFCDKGLEVAFRKSTCFVRKKDGVDFLTCDRSSNLYTISLKEIASNSSACLLAKVLLRNLGCGINITKSPTTNVETSNVEIPSYGEEVFHKSSESFQEESSSSSLNDDIQQSLEEVMVPLTNTKSVLNESVPNVNEASTSYNVFNERFEDAYFDTSTTIEPANVAEALKDADWVSAMQEELDQFKRLKFCRLDPQPKGKTIINTKWIFKNKKDESNLVIRNKARLVAQGYCQQEGIDYDETFAPLSKRTDKFETYFANLEKENALLKSQLASQNYTSLQKENNDLRTSYHVLKEKFDQVSKRIEKYETYCEELEKENNDLKMHYKRLFDSIKQKKVVSQVFTKSIPKVNVSEKIYTAESEYVVVSGYCAQVLWMRIQLTDYGFFYDKVPIYCDSQSAIAISCNLV